MNKTNTLAAFIVAFLLAVPAAAQEESKDKSGPYAALEIGRVTFKDLCSDLRSDAASFGSTVSSCSESEISFGAYGGYKFNQFFAAEIGARFADGFDTVVDDVKIDNSYTSVSLGGRGTFPINEYFGITGKAGFHFWDAEIKGGGVTSSDDGEDPYYGLGVSITPADNFAINLEYTRYKADGDDLDTIAASAVLHF